MKANLQYLKYPFLKSEIEKMGYELSGSVVAKACMILYFGTILVSFFYSLKLPYILILIGISTLSIPYHVYHEYKNRYQKKLFLDLTIYMEQMLYSFKRHPKILDALKDTNLVFSKGNMKALIQNAMDTIQAGTQEEIYVKALHGIECEYGCQRLRTMHNYLIKVEQRGGEYKPTADLLLEDRDRFKTSAELLEKEKKGKKKAINIVLVSTYLICAVMVYIFSVLDGINVVDNRMYQMVSTIFVIGNLVIWLVSDNKLGANWEFDDKNMDQKKIAKEYEFIQTYDIKAAQRKAKVLTIIPIAVVILGIVLKSFPVILIGLYYAYFLLNSPKARMKGAKKKVKRELSKIFPQWLMELTLLLQTENVYVALKQSIKYAPPIMVLEIKTLLVRLDDNPNSVEPYNKFFYELHMEEVATCMKILYSISAFDATSQESPIINLIRRNHKMMNKSEQIAGEDKLAIWTTMAYIPMATGGIKIILDMILLITALVTSITIM
ncbi:hypothetical protein LQZ18_17985 [Lachnospiraceae bacterium ZAX-1]